MDTSEINCILGDSFGGVFPSDKLPKEIGRPSAIIANTDPSTKPGEHWVAMFLKANGKGEYFDSFGLPPIETNIRAYLDEQCPKGWKYNPVPLQSVTSTTCGYYCVLYVLSKKYQIPFKFFLKMFHTNSKLNDTFVEQFLKSNTSCI